MVEVWMRKKEMGKQLRAMWRIPGHMRPQRYEMPDWVGKISYRWFYTPDRVSYLPYWGS
jgi:hypothetical protein